MKRISTETVAPREGGVYRNIGTCQDAGPPATCGECIATDVVGVISQPGCDTFPVTDNDYGRLPTSYGSDVEIDPVGYDARWDALANPQTPTDPVCPPPPTNLDYPDLWTLTGDISSALQDDVLDDDCYCIGQGKDQPSLSFGRPQFPRVEPLPFFAFPNFQSGFLTFREFNPDGPPLDGGCCPIEDELPEHIFAEIVGNEIRLTRREKPPIEEMYRACDTDQSFQLIAGYPQQCCMIDPCAESGEEKYVLREFHFPLWPGPNSLVENIDAMEALTARDVRNPYDDIIANREEPLGIIPVVVDIQCHDDGKLYVYYANLVIHDGKISGLQWNVKPPRSETVFRAGNLPPIPPEDLEVNRDYQDEPVWASIIAGPTRVENFDPIADPGQEKPWCEETCLQAATQIGKQDEACTPACPAENLVCTDPEEQFISEGTGATQQDAQAAALALVFADIAAECVSPDVPFWLCYSYYDEDAELWRQAYYFCCEPVPPPP